MDRVRMHPSIALALVLLLGGCASAPRMGFHSRQKPAVVQIDVGIANVFAIQGEGPVILVDAGAPGDGAKVIAALERMGKAPDEVALIVLSHGHGDHAGGADELRARTRAPILAHPGDEEMLANGRNRPLRPQSLLAWLIRPFVDIAYPPLEADVALERPLPLTRYGIAGRIIPLPGHTPGSVVIVLDSGDAIVGDLLAGGYFGGALCPGSPGGHYYHDVPEMIPGNIKRLLDMGVKRFHVGHGGPLDAADVRAALEDGDFGPGAPAPPRS